MRNGKILIEDNPLALMEKFDCNSLEDVFLKVALEEQDRRKEMRNGTGIQVGTQLILFSRLRRTTTHHHAEGVKKGRQRPRANPVPNFFVFPNDFFRFLDTLPK